MLFKKPFSIGLSAAMFMAFTPSTAALAAAQTAGSQAESAAATQSASNTAAAASSADVATAQQETAGEGATLGTYRVLDQSVKTAEFVSSQVTGSAAEVPANITLGDGQSYSVVTVADRAFFGMQKLTNIKIAQGVTSIGAQAFEECVSLKGVELPASLSSLGQKAFFYCTCLTGITLPSSLGSIEEGTFYGCSSLKELDIPSSVNSIGKYAFAECSALAKVTGTAGLVSIGARAFKRCGVLESFPFASGLKIIDERAFEECYMLKQANLPDTLEQLGERAFCECQALQSASTSLKKIPTYAFCNCYELKTITLRDGVESIAPSAFTGMSITDGGINIPKTVAQLDSTSFGCGTTVAFYVEDGNPNYTSVDGVLFSADKSTLVAYPGLSEASSYSVPDGTTAIAGNAFRRASETLKSVDLGKITQLGEEAFRDSASLKKVTFSTSLTSIPKSAFEGTTIKKLALPSNIKEIDERAFANTPLKTLDLGSVETIRSYAFDETAALKEVTVPASVTSLAGNFLGESIVTSYKVAAGSTSYKAKNGIIYSADGKTLVSVPTNYLNNKGKNKVSIASGCQVIGPNAFEGCSAQKITLPNTVTTIKSDAFEKLSENLYTKGGLQIPASVTTIEDYAIGYVDSHNENDREQHLLIVGKRGSAAESYALANDFAFATKMPKMKIAKAELAKKGKKTTVSVAGMKIGQAKFYSSDKSVVKVNAKGKVTAVGAGKTNIVAAMGSFYLHVNVKVGGKKAAASANPYKSYKQLCGKQQLKAWSKKYYEANKGVSFAKKSNPAIRCYTGDDYVGIKAAQGDAKYAERAKETYGDDIAEYQEISSLLKWELSRFKLPVSTQLYSGIGSLSAYTGAGTTLSDMQASLGKTLTHPVLISTSIFNSIAQGFADGAYGTVIHIYAPKNKTLGGYLLKFSKFPDEYELLLANDSKFKVVDCGVYYGSFNSDSGKGNVKDYQRYYTLEYLGNEE